MAYIDLDELQTGKLETWPLFSSKHRVSMTNFSIDDHMAIDSIVDAAAGVRSRVKDATGTYPRGPVRLLTNLRCAGIGFNPVSFYYVFDQCDEAVEAVVAEVGNIPWFEQHCYVATRGADASNGASTKMVPFGTQCKEFHVSPFMPIDGITYHWMFSDPGSELLVNISLSSEQRNFFYADLKLARRPFSSSELARQIVVYPLFTLKVMMSIHYEAIKLYKKDFQFYSHPGGAETAASKAIERIAYNVFAFRDAVGSLVAPADNGTKSD